MNRDMSSLGDRVSLLIKNCAGEVSSFFDIGGETCPVKGDTHFFSNRRESVFEDFQQYRIDFHGMPLVADVKDLSPALPSASSGSLEFAENAEKKSVGIA